MPRIAILACSLVLLAGLNPASAQQPSSPNAATVPNTANEPAVPAETAAQVPVAQDVRPSTPAAPAGKKGKKVKEKKEKKPKRVPLKIDRGTLTVDGYTGKAALNYDIPDLHYLYMYIPGVGTAVVSRMPFAGAKEQQNAFVNKGLSINAEGHVVELYSEQRLLSKKPEPAWVMLDPDFKLPSKYPAFGYGDVAKAPYAWPGSLINPKSKGSVAAPPLPKAIQPKLVPTPKPSDTRPSTPAPVPQA